MKHAHLLAPLTVGILIGLVVSLPIACQGRTASVRATTDPASPPGGGGRTALEKTGGPRGVVLEAKARKELFDLLSRLPEPDRASRIVPKLLRPSVVNILVPQPKSRVNPRGAPAKGTGFIIDARGYIATNSHVIEGNRGVRVTTLDGRSFAATVRGVDPKSDLAVLKINGKNLLPVRRGNSDDLEIGETVLAIGNAFGNLSHSVTRGIVSGIGRNDLDIIPTVYRYENLIQTDAAINNGNSGGPLINMRGEVIGVNTAIITEAKGFQGVGLAVPMNQAWFVLDRLIRHGKVVRGWLGVDIQNLDASLIRRETGKAKLAEALRALGLERMEGVWVVSVEPGGPGAKATPALRPGDIILEFAGKSTPRMEPFRALVAATPVGRTVKMKIVRNGKPLDIKIRIGTQPDQ